MTMELDYGRLRNSLLTLHLPYTPTWRKRHCKRPPHRKDPWDTRVPLFPHSTIAVSLGGIHETLMSSWCRPPASHILISDSPRVIRQLLHCIIFSITWFRSEQLTTFEDGICSNWMMYSSLWPGLCFQDFQVFLKKRPAKDGLCIIQYLLLLFHGKYVTESSDTVCCDLVLYVLKLAYRGLRSVQMGILFLSLHWNNFCPPKKCLESCTVQLQLCSHKETYFANLQMFVRQSCLTKAVTSLDVLHWDWIWDYIHTSSNNMFDPDVCV